MDPWLEASGVWPSVHHQLISKTLEWLQPQLKPRGYYVDIGERIWMLESERPVYPDNVIFKRRSSTSESPDGGTAVAILAPDEPVCVEHATSEYREPYLEIFEAPHEKLITGIEFVSPTNKRPGEGRDLYRQKQQELRAGGVNLVEVDLLRSGAHALDFPVDLLDGLRPFEYLVNLVRHGVRQYQIYPIRQREHLPRIRIPLKYGEDDAVLDLQAILQRTYEAGPYPERLHYAQDPHPPLSEDDAAWADEILRKAGLR